MTSLPKIEMEWQPFAALSATALYELLRFRQQIFVVEQASPYPDLDGRDFSATHLLARAAALVGYLRLLPPRDPGSAARIGRVAVSRELRGRGLGRRLIGEALAFCAARHPGREVVLDAQLHLAGYYEGFGFRATGAPYDDFGVAHVPMARRANPQQPPLASVEGC